MLTKEFNHTIDIWINELERSTFARICARPFQDSWSLGQVCMHLMEATGHYLQQARICLSTNDHASEEMSGNAKVMFQNNSFPDELIEGPPSNSATQQPGSKEQLIRFLIDLKKEISDVGILISASAFKGKTKHPGLNYFNAHEWMQFAEMHFRHHLRQKKRLDEFFKTQQR